MGFYVKKRKVTWNTGKGNIQSHICEWQNESKDSYLLLSLGYCEEDEFISEEALNDIA